MIQVIVRGKDPNMIMDIVRELRRTGLAQGIDFDFKYTPGGYEEGGWERRESSTEFTFYKDKYATLFAIQYSS